MGLVLLFKDLYLLTQVNIPVFIEEGNFYFSYSSVRMKKNWNGEL
jgi:hypothetical protein